MRAFIYFFTVKGAAQWQNKKDTIITKKGTHCPNEWRRGCGNKSNSFSLISLSFVGCVAVLLSGHFFPYCGSFFSFLLSFFYILGFVVTFFLYSSLHGGGALGGGEVRVQFFLGGGAAGPALWCSWQVCPGMCDEEQMYCGCQAAH